MKRGELWLAELEKRRPAAVVRAVPWLNEIHVVPITSTIRGLPSEIAISGMPKASVANAQRLMLLPKDQMVRKVGSVPEHIMGELANAICAVLDC